MTEARECPKCGDIHDWSVYVEIQILCAKLDRKINEFVDYINESSKEVPELEDK